VAALAVGCVYLWLAKSGWAQFEFKRDLDGYYDLLGRAFLHDHLQLPIEPRPELRALSDPWNPQLNLPYRVLDHVLYNRHYYHIGITYGAHEPAVADSGVVANGVPISANG